MINNKIDKKEFSEKIFLVLVLIFILINAYVRKDNFYAFLSAICGITYTFLAGKGQPICYLFGVIGSFFYGILAFQNALWGNLILYLGYYLPMQIIGYFKWSVNLKKNKKIVKKIYLPRNEFKLLFFILSIFSVLIYFLLKLLNDMNPLLDSVTAVFSIGGMYLTVRRAIEQWIFWMVVNLLSLIMWLIIALGGVKIYSTIAMWTIYLILAIYFYIIWLKELRSDEYTCNNK